MCLTQRKQSRDAPGAKRSGCLSEANPKGRKGPRAAEFLRVRATTKTVVAANRRRDSRLPRRLRFDAKHHRRVAVSSNLRLCRLNRHETPPGAATLKRPHKCGYTKMRALTNRKRHNETAPFLTRLRYSTLTYPLLHLDLEEETCRLFVLLNLGRNSKLHITIIRLSGVDLNCI